MNYKRGFTLIEMLAVISIIAVLSAIIVPSIILIKEKMNERTYNTKKEAILLAAQLYGQDNPNLFESTEDITITIGDLIENNYLEKDVDNTVSVCLDSYGCLINPMTKESMNAYQVSISKVNGIVSSYWIAG